MKVRSHSPSRVLLRGWRHPFDGKKRRGGKRETRKKGDGILSQRTFYRADGSKTITLLKQHIIQKKPDLQQGGNKTKRTSESTNINGTRNGGVHDRSCWWSQKGSGGVILEKEPTNHIRRTSAQKTVSKSWGVRHKGGEFLDNRWEGGTCRGNMNMRLTQTAAKGKKTTHGEKQRRLGKKNVSHSGNRL